MKNSIWICFSFLFRNKKNLRKVFSNVLKPTDCTFRCSFEISRNRMILSKWPHRGSRPLLLLFRRVTHLSKYVEVMKVKMWREKSSLKKIHLRLTNTLTFCGTELIGWLTAHRNYTSLLFLKNCCNGSCQQWWSIWLRSRWIKWTDMN